MLRALRRNYGISARRMAVRPDVPWYWRSLGVAAGAGFLVAALWLAAYASGALDRYGAGDAGRELARLQAQLEKQDTELRELRARTAQEHRQSQMDRAATADLAKHVKALTFENAALKEDLAFFQSLMSGAGVREGAISVNRFRLYSEPVAGEYRYQMLLVQGGGRRMKEFQGRLEFVLDVQQQDRKLVVVVPPETEPGMKDYQVNFRFFQRVQGTFKLAPGSVLKGVQVRVFENGSRAPKLTQSLSVS